MSTNKQITLGVVYKRLSSSSPMGQSNPCFSISGGTVDVYHYIKSSPADSAPADETAMIKDSNGGSNSAYGEDIFPLYINADYILFKSISGSPIVKVKNVIE